MSPITPVLNSRSAQKGDFLPDLCQLGAVFRLVLIGQLLVIALLVADVGVTGIDGTNLGLMSLLVQWINLSSAALLCRLRPWFKSVSPRLAGASAYAVVLAITFLVSYLGQVVQQGHWHMAVIPLLNPLLLAMVIAGIVLRYFYVQQQLYNQTQAELHARIQALQSRIRPHFLFNSMNAIASLIALDPDAAERMVEDLSDLFRASLSEPSLIPLSRELDICRRFVRIEHTRLGDRLQVEWTIAPEVLDVQVPSLLIQPLIENAIYHGIQPLPEGGLVHIKAQLHQGICQLEIANPLPNPQALNTKGNGLALENIRHRLAAHYGEHARWINHLDQGLYRLIIEFPTQRPHL